ncbi:MAG: hypothetical protein ABR541_00335 [Candidatus Dormibacteria bacterium]
MSGMNLRCPNHCARGLFEVVNATLVVDREGDYVTHEARRSAYLCLECRGVAMDVAAAARELLSSDEIEQATLTCPLCETEMLPPEDDPLATLMECPSCGHRFTLDEGMTHLHGEGSRDRWSAEPGGS